MTKKWLSVLLASALAVSFAACSDGDDKEDSPKCDPSDEVCKCQCYTSCLDKAGSDIQKALACVNECLNGQLVTDEYCEGVLSSG